jgi:hypothetical protein
MKISALTALIAVLSILAAPAVQGSRTAKRLHRCKNPVPHAALDKALREQAVRWMDSYTAEQ